MREGGWKKGVRMKGEDTGEGETRGESRKGLRVRVGKRKKDS